MARFTTEALWMPASCHSFDNTSNDELTALVATRGEQNMKITFTIFASFKLVENAILKGSEALSTTGNGNSFGKSTKMNDSIRINRKMYKKEGFFSSYLHEALSVPKFTV